MGIKCDNSSVTLTSILSLTGYIDRTHGLQPFRNIEFKVGLKY